MWQIFLEQVNRLYLVNTTTALLPHCSRLSSQSLYLGICSERWHPTIHQMTVMWRNLAAVGTIYPEVYLVKGAPLSPNQPDYLL